MKAIHLDWGQIKHLHSQSAKDVVDQFPEVFSDELGIIKGLKAKIHIKEDATPQFCKACSVPFAL